MVRASLAFVGPTEPEINAAVIVNMDGGDETRWQDGYRTDDVESRARFKSRHRRLTFREGKWREKKRDRYVGSRNGKLMQEKQKREVDVLSIF